MRLVPSSCANLCASFTSEKNPFSPVFSSNINTLLIIGSGFSYSFIARLDLIEICTLVLQTLVHDPFYLSEESALQWSEEGSHHSHWSTSLSLYHMGYIKTGKANLFVALTRLTSDMGLAQIIESFQVRLCCNCKC